jgi:hypothetical protein
MDFDETSKDLFNNMLIQYSKVTAQWSEDELWSLHEQKHILWIVDGLDESPSLPGNSWLKAKITFQMALSLRASYNHTVYSTYNYKWFEYETIFTLFQALRFDKTFRFLHNVVRSKRPSYKFQTISGHFGQSSTWSWNPRMKDGYNQRRYDPLSVFQLILSYAFTLPKATFFLPFGVGQQLLIKRIPPTTLQPPLPASQTPKSSCHFHTPSSSSPQPLRHWANQSASFAPRVASLHDAWRHVTSCEVTNRACANASVHHLLSWLRDKIR